MKKLTEKELVKTVTTYEVHEELPGIKLEVTKENGKVKEAILNVKGPHGSWPVFMKPGFKEYIQKTNPWVGIKNKYGIDIYRVSPSDILKSGSVDPGNFVWAYSAGHVLFDFNGDPIPTPYCLDYIGTPFTNEHCDLERMLPHLKSHPWVTNREELFIEDVPYYNNEGGWMRHIRGEEFPWVSVLPDAASLKEIYLRSLEIDKEHFSSRMKDLVMSGAVYAWEKTKEKDYLDIRQFYSPHKRRDW
jgi:hypothetical protein